MFDIGLEDALGAKLRSHYSRCVAGPMSDRMIRAIEELAMRLEKKLH